MSVISMKELESRLQTLVGLSEHLRQLLEQEKTALTARDITKLDTIVESKVSVQQQISSAETQLAQDLHAMGFMGDNGRIDASKTSQMPAVVEQGLLKLQQEALLCQQLMSDNESIVNVNLTQVGQALNMLRQEQSGDSTAVYNEAAKTEMHGRPRPDISVA